MNKKIKVFLITLGGIAVFIILIKIFGVDITLACISTCLAIMYFEQKHREEALERKYTRLKNALVVLNGKDDKLKIIAEKEFKDKDHDKFLFGMALYPNEGWVFLDDIYEVIGEKEHRLARGINETE